HQRFEALEAEVASGLIERLRLKPFLRGFPRRVALAGFVFINGFLTTGLLALVAMLSGSPFVFPSVGPTVFLFFFHPTTPPASPRNAILGHAVGIVCGYMALVLVGLQHAPSAMAEGVDPGRMWAAAISLALTGAIMILFRVVHPPAGATTLIVSLGIIHEPFHLAMIELAIVLLAVQAFAINRLAGVDYPWWTAKRRRETE
ncbi:MAG TPA: HPP family protein, partial [Pirellulales bacterium]